jgi:Fe-S-cluster containining protein
MGGSAVVTISLDDKILTHARDDELAGAMARFYAHVDEAIAGHKPVCINRGACCKFGSFGHKLYVTDVELSYFVRGQQESWIEPSSDAVCPFQVGGQCTAREHRPLGCRIFFCDPNAKDWQGPEYERLHAELVRIGESSGVRYQYGEWLSALGRASEALKPDAGNEIDV